MLLDNLLVITQVVSFLFLREDKENLMHQMWNIVCKFTKIITIDDNHHAD
jgi:hypothetical protein